MSNRKTIIRSHNLTALDMNVLGVVERHFKGQILESQFPELIEIFEGNENVIQSIYNLIREGFFSQEVENE